MTPATAWCARCRPRPTTSPPWPETVPAGARGTAAATSAELQSHLPALAVDAGGDLFVDDYYANVVREVTKATGKMAMVAGTGTPGYTGDDGPAVDAELWLPSGLAIRNGTDLLIGDSENYVVRQVDLTSGTITTVAGDGTSGSAGVGGPATSGQLTNVESVAADQAGDVFVADYDPDNVGVGDNNVRELVAATGTLASLASDDSPVCGSGAAATMAHDSGVYGTAVDAQGDLFFSEGYANVVCEVSAVTGLVSIVAGTLGSPVPYGGDGGPATSASLFQPFGLAVGGGDLYIADYQNNRVRCVDLATGVITTVAGDGDQGESGNGGPATSAELTGPQSLALDAEGDLYIDDGNGVREVSATTHDITGVVTVSGGAGIAVDGAGHLFIAAGSLQEYDLTSQTLSTVPGVGGVGEVAADAHGNVFVSGQTNYSVQRIQLATGVVTTVAGTGRNGYSGDGGPATAAELYQPMSISLDAADDLFIGQLWDGRVREVEPGPSFVLTPAGDSGVASGSPDVGPLTVSAVDPFGAPTVAPAGGTTVDLSSSSATGGFSTTPGGPATSSVTIPAGDQSATFYYGDTTPGTPTLSASAAGTYTGTQTVQMYGPPSAPTGVSVLGVPGPGQLHVAWTAATSNGAPVTSYTVRASPGGKTCTSAGTQDDCVVSGLTGGTSYTFTVTATNGAGVGPASSPSGPAEAVAGPGAADGRQGDRRPRRRLRVLRASGLQRGIGHLHVHGDRARRHGRGARRPDRQRRAGEPAPARADDRADGRRHVHLHRHGVELRRRGRGVGAVERGGPLRAHRIGPRILARGGRRGDLHVRRGPVPRVDRQPDPATARGRHHPDVRPQRLLAGGGRRGPVRLR